jgi:hypothetical protein
MKNKPNEERISRKAASLQWSDNNTQAVMDRLTQHGMIGELYRDIYIQVYNEGSYSDTLNIGDWLVEGEDEKLRIYDDETHALMYRPMGKDDELERLREFISDVYDIEMDQKIVDRIMELSLKHGVMGARVDKSLKEQE